MSRKARQEAKNTTFDRRYNTPKLFMALTKLVDAELIRRATPAAQNDDEDGIVSWLYPQIAPVTTSFYVPDTNIYISDRVLRTEDGKTLWRDDVVIKLKNNINRSSAAFSAHWRNRNGEEHLSLKLLPYIADPIFYMRVTGDLVDQVIELGNALPEPEQA